MVGMVGWRNPKCRGLSFGSAFEAAKIMTSGRRRTVLNMSKCLTGNCFDSGDHGF